MLFLIVSENRNGSSETSPTWARSDSSRTSLTSAPSIRTLPVLGSYRRGRSETSVDLPEPVPPTIAIVRPAGTSRSTPRRTGSPPPYANDTPPRRHGEGRPPQPRLAARVCERHAAQLHVPVARGQVRGVLGHGHLGLAV